MSIEYVPPALERIITSELATKRLKNREGEVIILDQDGKITGWRLEGKILEIHEEAKRYESEHPDLIVRVIEYSCGSTVTS